MEMIPTSLPEVLILEPRVFGDERGFFMESYNRRVFDAAVGRPVEFVQDNHSRSSCGVLRGLHFQQPPHAQGKLVRVTAGAVFDVAVDVRPTSPRYGQWAGVELTGQNRRQLWIPEGFAHGFLVLSDATDFLYKTTEYYSPQDEVVVAWNDPAIGVDWPLAAMQPVLSARDSTAACLAEATPFRG